MFKKLNLVFISLILSLTTFAASRGVGVILPEFQKGNYFENLIQEELNINFEGSGITPKIIDRKYLDKGSLKSNVDFMLKNPNIDGIFVLNYNEEIYIPRTDKFVTYPFGLNPIDRNMPSNISYIHSEPDLISNLNKMKELKDIKKITIVTSSNEKNFSKKSKADIKKLGIESKVISEHLSVEELRKNFENSDLVYLISNDKTIISVANLATSMNLPTFILSLNPDATQHSLMGYNLNSELKKRVRTGAFNFYNFTISDIDNMVENLGTIDGNLFFNTEIANKIQVFPNVLFIQDMDLVKEKSKSQNMKLSFKEAIQIGLNNNPVLKSSKSSIESQNYSYFASISRLLPQVGANLQYTKQDKDLVNLISGPENSTLGTLVASQVIFDDSLNANVYSEKVLFENSKLQHNQAVLDYTFNIAKTYLSILQSKAQLDIQKNNYNLIKEFLRISKIKYETGATGIQDLYRMESTLSDATSSLASVTSKLRNLEISLNTLLNAPVDMRYDYENIETISKDFFLSEQLLDKFLFDENKDRLLFGFLSKIAVENSNQILALENNIKILKRQSRSLTTSRVIPKISAFGQYSKNNIIDSWGEGSSSYNPTNGWRAGLLAELPLFTGGEISMSKKSIESQIDSLDYQKENLKNEITENVNALSTLLLNDYVQTYTTNKAAESAKKSLNISTNLYAAGSISVTEILDARNAALSAELANTISRYNFFISAVNLERAIGKYNFFATEEEKAQEIKTLERVIAK
ncbi:MAG: TolC family protein [Fusobacteriaceae bacterium]